MLNQLLLSIIIPIYNSEKYIRRCVESILEQDYKNIEIILVDDGSKDSSAQICDELAKSDRRIRVFHQKNAGPGSARNTGLLNCTGDFVTFVDADDTVEKEGYSKILRSNPQADLIIGQWNIYNEKCELKKVHKLRRSRKVNKKDIIHKMIRGDSYYGGGYPWNKIVNWKKLCQNCNEPILFIDNLKVYEDKCWVLDVLKYAENIIVSNVSIYNYYIYNDSLSHAINGTVEKTIEVKKALDHMLSSYKNTIYEKDINIELECNKLNELWYRYKLKYNDEDLKMLWKSFLKNRKYSVFSYVFIMKIKFMILFIVI